MPAETDYAALVRQGYESWNSGDRSWVLEHMSPDVEWIPPSGDPDRRTYVGYEGVEEFWSQWRAAVGQLAFRPIEITARGRDVVVVARREGRGIHSGLEVSDEVIQVFTFGEGDRVVTVREFYDQAEAIEATSSSSQRSGIPGSDA